MFDGVAAQDRAPTPGANGKQQVKAGACLGVVDMACMPTLYVQHVAPPAVPGPTSGWGLQHQLLWSCSCGIK